jgi:hypothetical protein
MIMLRTLTLTALQSYGDLWTSGEFWEAITGPYVDLMGLPAFAMLFFGSVSLAYYLFQGSFIMPVIMMILAGSVTVALAPNPVVRFAGIAFILTVAGAGYMLYQYRR